MVPLRSMNSGPPLSPKHGPPLTPWAEVSLAAGVYEYTYRVDGQPRTPPEAKRYQDDGLGGVLLVGE